MNQGATYPPAAHHRSLADAAVFPMTNAYVTGAVDEVSGGEILVSLDI